MAVDKKSQHVGNHGGRYTDIDGMTKQFTYIDHDKKTSIPVSQNESTRFDYVAYRKDLVDRILDLPASICPEVFTDFTCRGEGHKTVTWNQNMIRDNGISIDRLRDFCVLLENKAELMGLTIKVI